MKTILTYGTFDMFHFGHVELLRRLKSMGDRLVVGVSTDEFNRKKGKRSLYPYEHRAKIVESIQYVDQVIPEKTWEQKCDDITRLNVDIFAIGDDWQGKFDDLKDLCEVHYMPRTPDVSSTELRKSLNTISSVSKHDIEKMFELLELLKSDLL